MKRRAATIGLLSVTLGCTSVPKHDWERHAITHHHPTTMPEIYPRLARSYSLGWLNGFAVQFVSSDSIETITYLVNRKGELKGTQTSTREYQGLLREPIKE